MTKNRILAAVLILFCIAEIAYGFMKPQTKKLVTGNQTIELVHNPWDTEISSISVVALVLEEAGYKVNLTAVDNAVLYKSLAAGEADATTSAWLPSTHGEIMEEYKEDLVDLGPNMKGTQNGMVVPAYSDINSIEDLKDQVGQKIIGIEPGAGIMLQSETAMKEYSNLKDWKLESPSTGAMLGALQSAIDNNKDVVVIGWKPHWKFERFDLKFLEDPKNIFGGEEYIHTLTRKGFGEEYPEANQILDNFEWTPEDMQSITLQMEEGVDPKKAAQDWIDAHRDQVDQWLDIEKS